MASFIKNTLKRILPPPVNSFMREINDLRAHLNRLEVESEKQTSLISSLKEDLYDQKTLIESLSVFVSDQFVDAACRNERLFSKIGSICKNNEKSV